MRNIILILFSQIRRSNEDMTLIRKRNILNITILLFFLLSGAASITFGEAFSDRSSSGSSIVIAKNQDIPEGAKYIDYSEKTLSAASGSYKVLFFYASWCTLCRGVDSGLTGNTDKIPDNVLVFKVDYDKEKKLKKQYGIAQRHTFVVLDPDGNEIDRWVGGSSDDLIARIEEHVQ
jgi:thiol-disulfide isomerase/thioredoxin